MSFLPLLSVRTMEMAVLSPLSQLMDEAPIRMRICIFRFLHNLLFNWNTAYNPLVEHGSDIISGLNRAMIKETLQAIVEFIDKHGLSLLELTNDSCMIQDTILRFYEILPTICLSKITPEIVMISHEMACRLIFSPSPAAISRLCGIITSYRELCNNSQLDDDPAVATFNSLVLDICNILWRDNGFSESINSDQFGLTPEFIKGLDKLCSKEDNSLKSLFGITNSPLFVLISMLFLRTKEDDSFTTTEVYTGQITKDGFDMKSKGGNWLEMTYDDFRIEFLSKLKLAGYDGINELLYTSLKTLMDKRLMQGDIR